VIRFAPGLALCLAGFVVLGACGKKGPPLPPLRPQPARINEITARAVDLRVDVSIVAPAANSDGTTPSVIETIELYGLAGPASPAQPTQPVAAVAGRAAGGGAPARQGGAPNQATPAGQTQPAPAVTAAAIVQPDNLVGTAKVVPPAEPTVEGEAPTQAPVVITHDLAAILGALAADEAAPTIRYVAIGVGRGRRSPPSAVVEVPLGRRPGPVDGLDVTFDEASIVVSWAPAGEGVATVVDEVDSASSSERTRRSTSPVSATSFTLPVSFGERRCFEARHVVVAGRATIEGPPGTASCVTPLDAFPPPAPQGLVAIAAEGAVVLSWQGVAAPDLAGYLVLRGEGVNETLQPLTSAPVIERSYRDSTARPGVTYVYAVVAIDRAQPPNRSLESNRQTVVAR